MDEGMKTYPLPSFRTLTWRVIEGMVRILIEVGWREETRFLGRVR